MPYIPPIVAYSDHLGYLRCVKCHIASEVALDFAYDLSNVAIDGEICERCGEAIPYSQNTRLYVHV